VDDNESVPVYDWTQALGVHSTSPNLLPEKPKEHNHKSQPEKHKDPNSIFSPSCDLTLPDDIIIFDPDKEYTLEESRDLFAKLLKKKVSPEESLRLNFYSENAPHLDVGSMPSYDQGPSYLQPSKNRAKATGHTNAQARTQRRGERTAKNQAEKGRRRVCQVSIGV
jgi:hypothetical protein